MKKTMFLCSFFLVLLLNTSYAQKSLVAFENPCEQYVSVSFGTENMPIFQYVLSPGAAIVKTVEANMKYIYQVIPLSSLEGITVPIIEVIEEVTCELDAIDERETAPDGGSTVKFPELRMTKYVSKENILMFHTVECSCK